MRIGLYGSIIDQAKTWHNTQQDRKAKNPVTDNVIDFVGKRTPGAWERGDNCTGDISFRAARFAAPNVLRALSM
jgi:hypothetical protein